jgi:RHS repeat-associated protein
MRKNWGVWDWVYVIWTLIVCILALWGFRAQAEERNLVTAFKDFRIGLAHAAGCGAGRSYEQLRREGVANALELTDACRNYLTGLGYECRIVFGRVRLSPMQRCAWTSLPLAGIQQLQDNTAVQIEKTGEWELDLPWLQVLTSNLWGHGPADHTAALRVNVFPALIAQRELPAHAGAELDASALQLWRCVDALASCQVIDYDTVMLWKIKHFPATAVAEQLASYLAVEKSDTATLCESALPGYCGQSCLSPAPVAVLQEYSQHLQLPPDCDAWLQLQLLADGEELLSWRGKQKIIGQQCFALQWLGEPQHRGQQAAAEDGETRWQASILLGGQMLAESSSVLGASSWTLRCSRYASATASSSSDRFTVAVRPGHECRWLLSSATMAVPEEDDESDAVTQLLCRCLYLLDCQRHIAAAEFGWQDSAALSILLLQRQDGFMDQDGCSIWHLLLPEEQAAAYAKNCANLHSEFGRRPWSLARTLAPMLALEWLGAVDPKLKANSCLSVFRHAFQTQKTWDYLLEKELPTETDEAAELQRMMPSGAESSPAIWLGVDSDEEAGSAAAACVWPAEQKRCYLQLSTAVQNEITPWATISLAGTGHSEESRAALDFFCRAYRQTLALIKHTLIAEHEDAVALKDLTILALLTHLPDCAASLPRIESVLAASHWSRVSGNYPIALHLSKVCNWSLSIKSADAQLLWQEQGNGDASDMSWNLCDLRQRPCADGSYVLHLRVDDGQCRDERKQTLILDSQAPELSLGWQHGQALPCLQYAVNDASPTKTKLLLTDQAGTLIQHWRDLPQHSPAPLCVDGNALADGNYVLTLHAEDAAGNRSEKELPIEFQGGQQPLPELCLCILGHREPEPVLTDDVRIEVVAKALGELCGCALFLDDEIMLAWSPDANLSTTLQLAAWPSGRHLLQAMAWNDDDGYILSDKIVCYFSPEEDADDLPPLLTVSLEQWAAGAEGMLRLSAWDNRDLHFIRIWQDGVLLSEANFAPGSQEGELPPLALSAAMLAEGLWLQAGDRAGHLQQQVLRYPEADAGAEKPLLVFCSPQLNDGPLREDILYQLYKESPGNLAYLSLWLNGEPLFEHYFPQDIMFAGTIALADCRGGDNVLELRALGSNGCLADRVLAHFTVPIITEMSLMPDLLRLWAGDDPMLTLTATLRQDCEWVLSVPTMPTLTPLCGYGTELHWSFSCADFLGSEHLVRLDLPSLGLWRERPLRIEQQRGELIARISRPSAGLLKEAVLSVEGSARHSEDERDVSYRLAVRDEYGQGLIVCPRQNDPHCAALLPAQARSAAEDERCFCANQAVWDGELALLDLSGLPDGRYELQLEVRAAGECAADQVVFQLASQLKSGPLLWREQDLRVPSGAMVLNLSRKYASDALNCKNDSDFGPGWSLNLSAMDVAFPEERQELMDVFGQHLSIRQGGSRDVCVTLPDGRRVTFVHELVAGGGMSFCYYAQWHAAAASTASLTPTVSNKLMALPGLEPYWEAAGMATPWQYYDFPAFVLSCEDGTKYLLERELLGSAELLVGGADGPDDGETYAHVTAYGQARLREMTIRTGERFIFAEDSVSAQSPDGRMKDILRIERGCDAEHRITAIDSLQGERQRLEYDYDELGRLGRVWQSKPGMGRQLRRSYAYENELFPYHLTAVRDAHGVLLFGQRFDSLGRLCATINADGAEASILRDCIAGVELRRDALGRETTILHDHQGLVTAILAPDASLSSYDYDEDGRECAVTNPLGERNLVLFDEAGRVQARVEPLGQRTEYHYADNGSCRRIVDALGRHSDYLTDAQGRNSCITTVTGDMLTLNYDAQGRLSDFSGGGDMAPILISYDEHGRPELVTDMHGLQIQSDYDANNQLHTKTLRFFTEDSSQVKELSVAMDYDEEGRPIACYDSLNNWQQTCYDYRGRAVREVGSDGQGLRRRFDAMDRVVESWDTTGLLWRFVYDAAGQQILAAGPFALAEPEREQPPALIVFPQAERRSFDVCGRLKEVEIVQEVALIREELGADHYRCELLAVGTSIAAARKDYDAAGRLLFSRSLSGIEHYYSYDGNGRCIAKHDALGRGQRWEYDAVGNITAQSDAAGNQTFCHYDERGFPAALMDAAGAITLCDYDAQGRLRSTQNPVALLVSNSFTAGGQLASVRLGKLSNEDSGKDDGGKLVRRGGAQLALRRQNDQDATCLAEYSYEYNASLGLAAIVDPLGRRHDFQVDEFGRQCWQRLPMGQESSASYEGCTRAASQSSDFLGNSISCSYDAQGRLQEKRIVSADKNAAESHYRYDYDSLGRCAQISLVSEDGALLEPWLCCEYNVDGCLVRQENAGQTLQREYDADRRLLRQWTEHSDLHYSYDAGGALASIEVHKAAGRELLKNERYYFDYDVAGRLRQLSRPDGSSSEFVLDGRGLVSRICHRDAHKVVLHESDYEYDAAGRCVSALDKWQDEGASYERRRSYGYDDLGRLRLELSYCDGLAVFCYSEESTYDAAGNRIRVVHGDAQGAMRVKSLSYDDNDRLLKEELRTEAEDYQILYTWDANGSLLSRSCGSSYPEERRYVWDGENRLTAVHISLPKAAAGAVQWSLYYDYDGRGMLCGCTRERRQNQLLECSRYRLLMTPEEPGVQSILLECHLLAGTHEESVQTFVHGGQLLARYDMDAQAWQCEGDRLGSVLAERAGKLWLAQGYDARGQALRPSAEAPGHGFGGEWQDPISGLIFLRSRFYSPEMGLFISRDSHPGQLSQPSSLHKYAYCLNDPVNRSDPSGSFSMLSCMSTMWTHACSMGSAIMHYRVPLQIATELSWGAFSLSDFMARDAEQPNATVLVHGVMPHFPGYAKDLTAGLEQSVSNQDYYEFLWSGFSIAGIPWLPNPLQHNIAKASLRLCLLTIAQKGYRHLSLIGHSWGTVLSLDTLEQRDVPMHTWVTMGSPLPRVLPFFPLRNWLNVFTPSDPVVYLQILPFTRFSGEAREPLFTQEFSPAQLGLGNRPLHEAHSCYWTDAMTIKEITNLLKGQ